MQKNYHYIELFLNSVDLFEMVNLINSCFVESDTHQKKLFFQSKAVSISPIMVNLNHQ